MSPQGLGARILAFSECIERGDKLGEHSSLIAFFVPLEPIAGHVIQTAL